MIVTHSEFAGRPRPRGHSLLGFAWLLLLPLAVEAEASRSEQILILATRR